MEAAADLLPAQVGLVHAVGADAEIQDLGGHAPRRKIGFEVLAPGVGERDFVAEGVRVAEDRDPQDAGRRLLREVALVAKPVGVRMEGPGAPARTRRPAGVRIVHEETLLRSQVRREVPAGRGERDRVGREWSAEEAETPVLIGRAEPTHEQFGECERAREADGGAADSL